MTVLRRYLVCRRVSRTDWSECLKNSVAEEYLAVIMNVLRQVTEEPEAALSRHGRRD
jgi:hypothetical protein